MLEGVYEKEVRDVRVIVNAKNVLQNFRYKMMKDKNMVYFLENLVSNAKGYDSMERMEKYYFNDDLKSAYEVLNLFMTGLEHELSERSGADFLKCCNLFPDHGGEECMYIVSHIPLVSLLEEKRKYENYLAKYSAVPEEGDEKSYRWDMRKHQREVLFEDRSMFHRRFPKDKDLVDYDLRNEHIDFVKEKYETEGRLGEVNAEIDTLVSVFEKFEEQESSKGFKQDFGAMYWDGVMEKKKTKAKEFAKVFEEIIKGLSKDK